MYDEVWSRVVRGNYQKVSAQLRGYRRLKVKGQDYPGLVKGDGAVSGYVWLDVENDDVTRLDAFEEKIYMRVQEDVYDRGEQALKVEVYVVQEAYFSVLEEKEWDPQYFETHGLKPFTRNYSGFHRQA